MQVDELLLLHCTLTDDAVVKEGAPQIDRAVRIPINVTQTRSDLDS